MGDSAGEALGPLKPLANTVMSSRPILLPARHAINAGIGAAILLLLVWFIAGEGTLHTAADVRSRRAAFVEAVLARFPLLPIDLPTVSVEAGVRMGWERYADASVSIDRFGASAPGEKILEELGITPANVAAHVRELLS